MRVFTVGIIGFGYWGKILARYFEYHPGFDLRGVATRNPESVSLEHMTGVSAGSPESLLLNPDIEVIVIATPIGTHYPLIRGALAAGKHVFCEKPLTLKGSDARAAGELARRDNLILFTDYIFTFSPAVREMVRLVREGAIGRVRGYSFIIRQLGHFCNDVYADLGSHVLSVIDMLIPLDQLEFSRDDIFVRDGIVETGHLSFRPTSSGGEGVRGSILLSFNQPFKERTMSVYGDRGTLLYDMTRPQPLLHLRYSVNREESRDPLNKHSVTYEFDEMNTLREVTTAFYEVLTGVQDSNLDSSIRITEALARVGVSGLRHEQCYFPI